MKSDTFRVQLEKDNLVFSAAHFITFDGNICESIHGHNYRVKCEVIGALDENGYVVDFIALRDALQEIVNRLDHHVVLPTLHPTIQVAEIEKEVVVKFE
ncbi:MAG: 6-pyruvoyl tetrahydrobiopterin synthase, partial [Hyphomicrobiales bacterium]|nr:6-pyruvoyl tetrahydrobiopterin synthase [Hyphomicrobiales bacterium]